LLEVLKYYTSLPEFLLFQIASRGYHNSLQRMWDTYWEAESSAQSSRLNGLAQLKKSVDRLEPESDKKK